MFEFTNKFDKIENDELILNVIQKYSGDDEMIPFYYYDILRKADNVTVGKISIRIGNNFHRIITDISAMRFLMSIVGTVMLIKQV